MCTIDPIDPIYPIYWLDLIDWILSDWPVGRNINRTLPYDYQQISITFNWIWLNLIRLYRINCFFGPCSWSKICFTQKCHVWVFADPKLYFFTFYQIKKNCDDLSKFQPVNSDLRPFRAFWDDSVPKQPTLKLKSGRCLLQWFWPVGS